MIKYISSYFYLYMMIMFKDQGKEILQKISKNIYEDYITYSRDKQELLEHKGLEEAEEFWKEVHDSLVDNIEYHFKELHELYQNPLFLTDYKGLKPDLIIKSHWDFREEFKACFGCE